MTQFRQARTPVVSLTESGGRPGRDEVHLIFAATVRNAGLRTTGDGVAG